MMTEVDRVLAGEGFGEERGGGKVVISRTIEAR